MKEYLIKFKDICIELSERPEIYLFIDESCTESEWIPFDINKLAQCQNWVMRKSLKDNIYTPIDYEKIRFKLKNPEDINIFNDWMSEYTEAIRKKDYVKDIEYHEANENITFLNSALMTINDDYVEIYADHIINL